MKHALLILLLLAAPALPQDAKQAPAPVDPAKAGIGRTFTDPTVAAGLQDAKALVVAFSGRECPISKLYKPRLDKLSKDYAPKGVRILTVASDDKGFVALFGPERSTETFVLDPKGVLRYRGAVDDQYGIGYTKDAPTRNYLVDAIEALLAGKLPPVPATEAPGCAIEKTAASAGSPGKASAGKITFHKDIEPIFQKRCVECHRPGEVGPFSLLKYDKAKSSAKQIKEVVVKRRMPPWHADPKIGEWKNDRHLSTQEIDAISGWVDAGAPEGDAKDAPAPRKFLDGWQIGTPDAVYTIPKKERIPAEGTIPYRTQFVITGLKEDKWVQAVEIRPTARAVVHHVLAFALSLSRLKEKQDGLNNYVGIYVPGESPMVFPEATGKFVAAGSVIVFQIHYTATGEAAEDQTSIGFIWAKKPPKHEITTYSATNTGIRIPAGAGDHPQEAAYTFTHDAQILSFLPHMHVRGKAFKYVAVGPDGREEVLLDVPRYDFNWQTCYRLKEPRTIKKGTTLKAYARFDNSKENPFNPDPTKDVRWGQQTWEEMLVGYFDYVKIPE